MCSSNPLVSIIISNFNYCAFVANAIDSAIGQSYSQVEVIVVDDGSTDGSQQIIGRYKDLITIIFKQNGGQASALNQGFKQSSGEIIIFLNADDMLEKTAVEKVVKNFSCADIAKIHWPLVKIDSKGIKTGEVFPCAELMAVGSQMNELIEYGPSRLGCLPQSPPTSANAWSRKFLEKVMPLSEPEYRTGGNDYHLSALAPLFGQINVITEPLGFYRVHGNNDTLKPLEDYIATYFVWFDHTCSIVKKWLNAFGYPSKAEQWNPDAWYVQLNRALKQMHELIPTGSKFILIDENSITNSKLYMDRFRCHFMEKDGEYYGLPADDDEAIEEVRRQAQNSISHLCFLWPSFWYLDYYKGFNEFLTRNYKCIAKSESLLVFDLRR